MVVIGHRRSLRVEEFFTVQRTPTLVERFLAEALGTFLLVFVGAGAAASLNIQLHAQHRPSTLADLLVVALALGFGLFVAVLVVGKISGAHVNPAITLALASNGRLSWTDVPAYIGGQIVGAVLGALGMLVVFGKDAATIGGLGAPTLAVNTSAVQGMFAEALGAFILMLAVMGAAIDSRAPAGWAGLTIGMALAVVIMFIGPATGASVNPARAFGPDLIDAFFGVSVRWGDFIVAYLIGPIIGTVAAAFLYGYIARLPRPARLRR
jgi:glycerol uptake facilitator protein